MIVNNLVLYKKNNQIKICRNCGRQIYFEKKSDGSILWYSVWSGKLHKCLNR
jgi:hypothetical protein